MTSTVLPFPLKATQLRQAFDESFALSPATEREAVTDLLAIRVASDPYALRLSEIGGLHVGKRILPLPGPRPELRGLAGFRGAVLPVYDLRALLGYGGEGSGRWILVAALHPAFALSFDDFEGHMRVPASSLEPGGPSGSWIVQTLEAARPLLELAPLLHRIQQRSS